LPFCPFDTSTWRDKIGSSPRRRNTAIVWRRRRVKEVEETADSRELLSWGRRLVREEVSLEVSLLPNVRMAEEEANEMVHISTISSEVSSENEVKSPIVQTFDKIDAMFAPERQLGRLLEVVVLGVLMRLSSSSLLAS